MKPVAIVIVGYDKQDYTEQCIDYIYRNTTVPFHLIVVDNGSKDGTKDILVKFASGHSNFTPIYLSENKGFGGGFNVGMQYALDNLDFDYLLVLNNDTVVTPHYMERLIDCIERSPQKLRKKNVGVVGPVSNMVAGRQAVTCPQFDNFESLFEHSDKYYESNKEKWFEAGRLIGFCLLLKREVLKEVGLFDDSFFPGMWEDNDYSVRIREAGYQQVVAVDTFIYHYGSQTLNHVSKDTGKIFEENKKRFYEKYKKLRSIGSPKRLIGVMRVRDGEPFIGRTLESLSRMCTAIVVFDDHSTDRTAEICKNFTKVNYVKSPFETFDEARDRDYLLQEAKKLSPDWIWSADHDEIPEEKLITNIQELLNYPNPETDGFVFRIAHFWNNSHSIRVDGLWGGFLQCRLFRNIKGQEIIGDDEGLHSGSHPFIAPENIGHTYYRIKHYGNMDPKWRDEKYKRYTVLDKNKDVAQILGGHAAYYHHLYYDKPSQDKDSTVQR